MINPAFVLILVMLALGWASRRLGLFDEAAAEPLNRFVIWICLPALILLHVPTLQPSVELLGLALIPWVILAISTLLILLLSRAFSWSRPITAVLLVCVPLGNTSFLGYPLVEALLGADSVRYAVVYDQLGSFMILSLFGLPVLAFYSGTGRPSMRELLKRIVTFPPFIALLLALLPIDHPQALRDTFESVGAALVPVVTFAVGLQLRLRPPGDMLGPLLTGLLFKLALGPLLAFTVAIALGMEQAMLQVAVLEAAMPTMITAAALAIHAGFAPRLAAALVGYGILISVFTLPALVWLMGGSGA